MQMQKELNTLKMNLKFHKLNKTNVLGSTVMLDQQK
jgi:hypothetical protein